MNDKGSVSSVSCEKPEATVALLLLSWSKYPNIVTVNLFKEGCCVFYDSHLY